MSTTEKHIPGAKSPKASPEKPEQHTFVPEHLSEHFAHLPEHERLHVNDPQVAHEKAAWMLPYLRAGSESVRRGGDFFGGDEPYERQLAALKAFYGKNEAPNAPESKVAPEAPSFAKGGTVHRQASPHLKQLNSIGDTFERKLSDKEKLVSSLEKAVERKPSIKLSKRLQREKEEVKRIRSHLMTVRSHV